MELRLGTRGSQLALWQANTVAALIAAGGGPPCRIVVIKTSGDRLQEAPILTKAHIEAVMRPRRNRPLFIIDIAMPRDVEAAAGEIEQVFLYNIDDLQTTVRENLARRASEVVRAETIVNEEVNKFGAWFRSRAAIPTIVALRERFEAIRRAELERLDFKLSSLPPEARARVDEITRASMKSRTSSSRSCCWRRPSSSSH